MPAVGPRTAAGKMRSSRNAQTHGLSILAAHDEDSARIRELADHLRRQCKDPRVGLAAERAARAQVDIERINQARAAFLAKAEALSSGRSGACDNWGTTTVEIGQFLLRIVRYERRALTQWRKAINELEEARARVGL